MLKWLDQQALGGESKPDVHEWLVPADRRSILSRLLRNLKRIYLDNGQISEASYALNLLLVIDPNSVRELRERGNLYRRLECWAAAVADLEATLASGGLPGADAEDVRQALVELRSRPRLLH